MQPEDIIEVSLEDDEREVLRNGLNEWLGPAHCTDEFALAIGFSGARDLWAQCVRLRDAVAAGESMTRLDWCRVLLASELVFVSDVVGSGHDWMFTTAMSDEATIDALRRIQRKLTREVRPLIGNGLGTVPNSD